MGIRVQLVDVTTLTVDAIVNAANEALLTGGGVDGAIHDAAGPELLEACMRIPEVRPGVRCPTGEARITPAFALPARLVIHTVAPVWWGGDSGEEELLRACYRSVFDAAAKHDVKSIAIPGLGCGAFRYPLSRAAKIAVEESVAAVRNNPGLEVILAAVEHAVKAALDKAIREHGGGD
jgi:O-acetyl-ADP-ribose deacetylase